MIDSMNERMILQAEITALYKKLDKKFHLKGATLPIFFDEDEQRLGAYVSQDEASGEGAHFYFSLAFLGYGKAGQIPVEDRKDLYLHEYAHYMAQNMEIPSEYQFQPGIHGSAWKYCCSLVGAAPTPFYKFGEALRKHDYDKVLKNPIHDKTVPMRDRYQQEQAYRKKKNSQVSFEVGEKVNHPKYGEGVIQKIQATDSNVRLVIEFSIGEKTIDQQWLKRSLTQSKF